MLTKRGHQHDVPARCRRRGGRRSRARRGSRPSRNRFSPQPANLEGTLSHQAGPPGPPSITAHVVEAEGQQHRLLQPLVDLPAVRPSFSATRSSPRSRPSERRLDRLADLAGRVRPHLVRHLEGRLDHPAQGRLVHPVRLRCPPRASARAARGGYQTRRGSVNATGRTARVSQFGNGRPDAPLSCRGPGAARYLSRWPRTRVHSRRTGAHRQVVVVVTRLGGFPHDLLAVAVCVADLCRALCCRSAPARRSQFCYDSRAQQAQQMASGRSR